MAIHYQILGAEGADNVLYVEVDSGQAQSRLLFDCGARCLDALPVRTLQAIDHVFVSS